jgi:hypothetical protein
MTLEGSKAERQAKSCAYTVYDWRYAIRTLSACAPSERDVEDRQLFRDGRWQAITDRYMLGRSGSR